MTGHIRLTSAWLIVSFLAFCVRPVLGQQATKDNFEITGTIVDANDLPVSDADVRISLLDKFVRAKSDAQGKFSLLVRKQNLGRQLVVAESSDRTLIGAIALPTPIGDTECSLSPIKLEKPIEVDVKVVDENEDVVPNADVGLFDESSVIFAGKANADGIASFIVPNQIRESTLFAKANGKGFDYLFFDNATQANDSQIQKLKSGEIILHLEGSQEFIIEMKDEKDAPLANVKVYPWLLKKEGLEDINLSLASHLFSSISNEAGIATIDWIPKWHGNRAITYWPMKKGYTSPRLDFYPDAPNATRQLTTRLRKKIPVSGIVVDQAGEALPAIRLRFSGRSHEKHDNQFLETDKEGKFEMLAYPDAVYLCEITQGRLRFAAPTHFTVRTTEIADLQFTAADAIRVFGQVTEGPTKKAVVKSNISLQQSLADYVELPIFGEQGSFHVKPAISHFLRTDSQGKFEFWVGAGSYQLRGHSTLDPKTFAINENSPAEIEFDFAADRPATVTTSGVVKDENGIPVADASFFGVPRFSKDSRYISNVKTDKNGHFKLRRGTSEYALTVISKDKSLRGVFRLSPMQTEANFQLRKSTTVTGRLVTSENTPLANQQLSAGYNVKLEKDGSLATTLMKETVTTDENGEFEFSGFVQGQKFTISRIMGVDELGRPNSWRDFQIVQPRVGQETLYLLDLEYDGDNRVANRPEKDWKLDYYDDTLAGIQFIQARRKARQTNRKLLLVFANPESKAAQQFGELKTFSGSTQSLLQDYVLIHFDVSQNESRKLEQLYGKLKIGFPKNTDDLNLVVINQDGEVETTFALSEFQERDGSVNLPSLEKRLRDARNQLKPANDLISEAQSSANKNNQLLLVQVYAGWCERSQDLRELFSEIEPLVQKHVKILTLDIRSPESSKVLTKFLGQRISSPPWYGIIDSDNRLLASSQNDAGKNLGYPWNAESRAQFRVVLEAAGLATDLVEEVMESVDRKNDPDQTD